MTASDWIALSSAAVAVAAFLVGARALQLQQAAAADDARQEFDELIHKLGLAVGQFNVAPGPGTAANPSQAMVEVQTLALQAEDLLSSTGYPEPPGWRRWLRQLRHPSGPPLEANWNETVVLASSFAQVWDVDRAREYWGLAIKQAMNPNAQVGPSAQINTLRSNGIFFYLSNSRADIAQARAAFDHARSILKPEINGIDLTYEQNFSTSLMQAQQEDQLGNTPEAARWLRDACDAVTNIQARWRRERARNQIVGFVIHGGDPDRFSSDGGLPEEIVAKVAELRNQSGLSEPQRQALDDAWRRGYAAGQQQLLSTQPHLATASLSEPPPGLASASSEDGRVSFPLP